MRGAEVNSSKWSDSEILYDDAVSSVIWGRYDSSKHRVLGMRWNGETPADIGFPSSFGHASWFVVPENLTAGILASLRTSVWAQGASVGDADKIGAAEHEFAKRLRGHRMSLAVALYAAAAKGKTPTLNLLIDRLLATGTLIAEEKIVGTDDRRVVLNHDGIIIGVGTGGDDHCEVGVNFDFFMKYGCDISFSATRKRGDSRSWTEFWSRTAMQGMRYEAVEKMYAPSGATPAVEATVNARQVDDLINKYL